MWGHVVGFTHILLHSEPFRHLNSRLALSNATVLIRISYKAWLDRLVVRGLPQTFVHVAAHRVAPATAERFRPTATRPSFSSGHTVRRTLSARRLRRTCARIHELGPDRVRTRPLSRRKDPARSGPGGVASTPESAAHGIDSGETNLTARNCGHVCLGEKFVEFLYRAVTDVAAAHGPGAR